MDIFSTYITDYLVKKNIIKAKDYNIYHYGFVCSLELLLNLFASILIAVFLKMEIECILFFLFFIPLRSYIGGIHLPNFITCFIFSCLTLFFILLLVKFVSVSSYVSFFIYLLSNIALLFIRYVNHPNRPVSQSEASYFQKKINATFIFGIFMFLLFYFFHNTTAMFLEALTFLLVAITAFLGKQIYRTKQSET